MAKNLADELQIVLKDKTLSNFGKLKKINVLVEWELFSSVYNIQYNQEEHTNVR